ncbi:hypothetical protein N7492_010439 [Penicillium capsulatum]|uniref:Uncharacterized protein n=1 Tax=Penicillium capsulatum TaxID=69766 RepID=A0A9W9HRD1_9EURO|nr:hypothetical protein N7492_010439 [Penicillium capsulatum]
MLAMMDELARFGLIASGLQLSGWGSTRYTSRRGSTGKDPCTQDLKRPQQDASPLTESLGVLQGRGSEEISARYSDRRRVRIAYGEWRSETRQEPDRNRQNGPAYKRQSLRGPSCPPPKFPNSRSRISQPKIGGSTGSPILLSTNGVRRPWKRNAQTTALFFFSARLVISFPFDPISFSKRAPPGLD